RGRHPRACSRDPPGAACEARGRARRALLGPRHRRVTATAAERLARFGASLAYEEIPADVVEAAKLHLLDTVGCGLAAHALGVGTEARAAVLDFHGSGPASVIGSQETVASSGAALANGSLCHALDF